MIESTIMHVCKRLLERPKIFSGYLDQEGKERVRMHPASLWNVELVERPIRIQAVLGYFLRFLWSEIGAKSVKRT